MQHQHDFDSVLKAIERNFGGLDIASVLNEFKEEVKYAEEEFNQFQPTSSHELIL